MGRPGQRVPLARFEEWSCGRDDASLLALLNSHEGYNYADKDTPDGSTPEEDMSGVCADFAKVLGTDSIRGFL